VNATVINIYLVFYAINIIFALVCTIPHIYDAVFTFSLEHMHNILHMYSSDKYAIANDFDLVSQHIFMSSPNDNSNTTGVQQPVQGPSVGSAPVQGPSVGSAPAQNP
jgi:hypothetical protein